MQSQQSAFHIPPTTNPGAEDQYLPRSFPENTPVHGLPTYSPTHASYPPYVDRMEIINPGGEGERTPSQASKTPGASAATPLVHLLGQDAIQETSHSTTSNAPRRESQATSPRREALLSALKENLSQPKPVTDDFLPPIDLADRLMGRFWDHIYCLYPFFDRASFQDAYDNLWVPQGLPGKPLSELNIGLGSRRDSESGSFIFNCAVNTAFALGCHFADIPVAMRQTVADNFFRRAKQHVGLDLLNSRSIGAVQALLMVALYLQSTPDPHTCWNLIGVACRMAQGLGMHEAHPSRFKDPLELEICRRTWQGIVMMDKIVSLTDGHPSMTSGSNAPLPSAIVQSPTGEAQYPSPVAFYVANMELYKILDRILSDVYKVWRGRPRNSMVDGPANKQAGLDVALDLEEKLLEYESNLPSFLNWKHGSVPDIERSEQLVLERQRNVLHARLLYLVVLLYRPIFTTVCSEIYTGNRRVTARHSTFYLSMLSRCASTCVRAAIDLISLIYETYKTSATDTWWHNGFYTSTAAIVLIISYTGPVTAIGLHISAIDAAWQKCEQILQHLAIFSVSGRNTLQFLSSARTQILSSERRRAQDRTTSTSPDASPGTDLVQLFKWYASMGPLASDEMGFLGPFDFDDFREWAPEATLAPNG